VGSLAVQLARRAGARVVGIASDENAEFLRSVGVEPVAYGDSLTQRLQELAPKGLSAFIDLFGGGYVELAAKLGVPRERINTIIDFAAAEKYGTKADGSSAAASRETLASVANLLAWGEIVMPLTAIYPFVLVRDAYVELSRRRARGKIVLAFDPTITEPLRP
jgi:NADPH:quinone reductase-like Zn-dependent oxidoreductase